MENKLSQTLDMDDNGYAILPPRGSLDLNSSKKMIQEYMTAIYHELLQFYLISFSNTDCYFV